MAQSDGLEVQIAAAAGELPAACDFSRWAGAALKRAGLQQAGMPGRPRMTVRLVDDNESSKLNATYRDMAGPTNVLAFSGPEGVAVPAAEREFGDLVICLPLVRREARVQGKAFIAHLAHLVVHGTLHLAGFDHDNAESAGKMEALEKEVMQGLGYQDPYRDQQ